jgi:hypothetical protein
MGAFQGLAHQIHIAHALEGVIRPAAGKLDQMRHQIPFHVLGIDEMAETELLRQLLALGIEVNAHDHGRGCQPSALHHIKADAAQAEHHHMCARLDLGRLDHRAYAGGDATTDIASLVEGRVGTDFRQCNLRQHREIREGRAAHIMMDRFALERKAAGAVGHQALSLSGADGGAEIGLVRGAAFALTAFGRVERDHMIVRFDAGHALSHLHHHTGTFVTQDDGEEAFGIGAGTGELVGVANPGGFDLNQHFPGMGTLQVHFLHNQGLTRAIGDSSAAFHGKSP